MLDALDMSKRLCYIEGCRAYFVDDFENVTGDDWNDAPYQTNASEPYKEFDATIVYFDGNFTTPADMCGMIHTSVDIMNSLKYNIPWLYFSPAAMLMPGSTLEEFIEFVKSNGGNIYAKV
jgi:hypothetical protein